MAPIIAAAAQGGLNDAALTVALALAAGLVCQTMAHHLRAPGIVVLLIAGALLGPDGLNLVRPYLLGDTLQTLVGFAVAVILFEGGMNLNIRRLRRESIAIRQLVTTGAVITAVGGALSAHVLLGWDWRLSILFGTLVIVTGPTVITPLVRRIKLNPKLGTILEAEGVLIDPIGAIIAVVALEVAIQPSGTTLTAGVVGIATRLGAGALAGAAAGFVLAYLLKPRWLIPEGLRNVFTLAWVLALFHVANAIFVESGIAAVTAAGLVVGNIRSQMLSDLMEFKEQLTVMLIGLLFVLLSADVRFAQIEALGVPGLLTVAALMFVVRPVNMLVGTARSGLNIREKAFLAWMAPRGIVAAAVASFFAVVLENERIPGGPELQAMVFLVIAITVTVQGLTGGALATWLGVRRPPSKGYAILGANPLGVLLGRLLGEGGQAVLMIDSNADAVNHAQAQGLRTVFGNALEERTMLRAQIDSYSACIALTPNEEINLLFAGRARRGFKVLDQYVALHLQRGSITPEMVHGQHAHVLFGMRRDLDLWSLRIKRELAVPERWRLDADAEASLHEKESELTRDENHLLPLVRHRKGQVVPVADSRNIQTGDEVTFLVFEEKRVEAVGWLEGNGWKPVPAAEAWASETDAVAG